jgi:cytochrome P450
LRRDVILRAKTMATAVGGRATSQIYPPPKIGDAAPQGGLLGLLPDLACDALGLLTRVTRDYGDLVRIRLGLTPIVVIGHPDLVEEVLVTRNHDYRKGDATRRLGSLLGKGLLLSEGDFWLRQRRLMQPAFHRQRLAQMADAMIDSAVDMANSWRDNEVRAINLEMQELTLRIVGRTLFGTDVGEDLARIRSATVVLGEHFRSRLYTLLTLLPDNVPTPGNVRYQAAVRDLDALVYRIIGERRAAGVERQDLLGMLLAARDEAGQGMTDRQLRDEVMTLLLAGHDTTALALTWAFVLLAQTPSARNALEAEVDAVLSGRVPSASDVSNLRYTDCVVTETLRLYPTAWAIGREALRDTVIAGHHVRRGTTVLIVPWVMHRDPRFFDAPDAFQPERWANGLAERLPRFAYLPFGGGQRVCIGSGFAQLEATLLLATLTQHFRLDLADPMAPIDPWPVVTLRTKADVPMRLIAR